MSTILSKTMASNNQNAKRQKINPTDQSYYIAKTLNTHICAPTKDQSDDMAVGKSNDEFDKKVPTYLYVGRRRPGLMYIEAVSD